MNDTISKNQKILIWFAVITVFAVLIWYNVSIYPWMLDDAFITFRYADNFASGHGLVYNIGERIEGYTTFLWALLLGLGGLLGLEIVIISKILAGLSTVGTILIVLKYHNMMYDSNHISPILGILFLGTCGIFVPWISSGMEVNLFAFLFISILYIYQKSLSSKYIYRDLAIVGFLLVLASMTRPEAALLVIIIFIDCLYRSIKNRDLRVIILIVPQIVLYVPYFIWRVTYYGYLLPNTYYAKVGYNLAQVYRGFEYLTDMLSPALLLVFFAIIGTIRHRNNGLRNGFYLMPLSVITYFIYVVVIGGDCMPAFRFFAPLMPVLCLLAGIGVVSIIKRPRFLVMIAVIICGYNLFHLVKNEHIGKQIEADKVVFRGKQIGLWLRDHFPPETVVATNTAGSIPYYSGFRIVDMLGLNDEHIGHREMPDFGTGWAGHEKGDGDYVLAKEPDLIQFGSSLGGDQPAFTTDRELYDNPRFHQLYELASYYIPALNRNALFYIKRDGGQ